MIRVACLLSQEKFSHTVVTAALKGYTVVLQRPSMNWHNVNFTENEPKHLQILSQHTTATHSRSDVPACTSQRGRRAPFSLRLTKRSTVSINIANHNHSAHSTTNSSAILLIPTTPFQQGLTAAAIFRTCRTSHRFTCVSCFTVQW